MDLTQTTRNSEVREPSVELTFPKSHFVPVNMGEFRAVSHLEKLIDLLNLKSNKYITHSKASMLDNPKLIDATLLLAVDYFYFVPKEEQEGIFETFSYLEIEKVEENKQDEIIYLQFYRTGKSEKDPPMISKLAITDFISQAKRTHKS
jgi:hypothetical protein